MTATNHTLIYPTVILNRMDVEDLQLKKNKLRLYAGKYVRAMDYLFPATRDYAVKLASEHPGKFSIQQICYIYDHIREKLEICR